MNNKTSSFLIFFQVLPTGCRRKSQLWPQAPWRSKSLLHQRESTPYGSVAPSWPPSPPSNRCGSPSRNTTSLDHPLCTGSASKLSLCYCACLHCRCGQPSSAGLSHQLLVGCPTRWPKDWTQVCLIAESKRERQKNLALNSLAVISILLFIFSLLKHFKNIFLRVQGTDWHTWHVVENSSRRIHAV